jgi:Na+/proline symporter
MTPMNGSSRTQGLLICAGAALTGVIFLFGLLAGSWWAVALPVGALLGAVLGLTFWVGWTIATVEVEPEPDPDAPGPGAPSSSDRSA